MRKLFLLLALIPIALGFIACNDEDKAPTVSFGDRLYTLSGQDTLKIPIKLSEPAKTNLEIEFTVAGSAVEETDYTISGKKAIILQGGVSDTIKIAFKENFGEEKNISLNLKPVVGYDFGKYSGTIINVPKDEYLYSFTSNYYTLSAEQLIEVELKLKEGSLTLDEDIILPLIIDEANSTAVKDEHYSLYFNKDKFTFTKGSKGTVKASLLIKFKKIEEGKNIIKLKLGEMPSKYILGDFGTATVKIMEPLKTDDLVGRWKYNSFFSEPWYRTNGRDDNAMAKFPYGKKDDILEFVTSGNKTSLKLEMEGDLDNYLMEGEIFSFEEWTHRLYDTGSMRPTKIKLGMAEMKINEAFSATTKVIRNGKVGFRLVGIDGKEMLEVTIIDFKPTDFLVEEAKLFDGMNPLMEYFPLRYLFEKVQ